MPSPSTFFTLHLFLIIFTLFSLNVQPKRVISEDGYTITTVLDGHKLHINPFSVLQRPTSSDLTMPSPSTFFTLHLFLIIFTLFSLNVQPKRVISEDGYTITTVLDGHKLHINPFSVLQRPTSSDLIILDSTNSTFYTVQLPISQESVFKRFSGNGSPGGYEDGDVGSAKFDKPRSFAVDIRGNVYVADRANKVIRKIGINGVTTIAGGSSVEANIKDGPAQNASFSNDFELTFVPALCALLVSDHMHQLIHQINLKEEDCTLGSKSGLGAVMTWTLGLGLSCILGLVIGIVIRPYIIPHTGTHQPLPFHRDMEALPNQFGEASTDALLRNKKRSC